MNKIKIRMACAGLVLGSWLGLMTLNQQALAQANWKNKNTTGSPERILPLDPAVRTGKLPNGFTYYIRHNEEPKNRVVFYMANKVGSVLETDDQQGLAHFMEHMSFNGTKHFPKNELVNYLQKSGVRFGADLNAYTNFDETVYQLPLPTDNLEILKNGIQIMRDWAQEATLDPVEIDKERGVVLEEKRLGMGAQERMQRQYWPVILNGSRYASRLPIGQEEILTQFKPEVIRRYYHDWYRPDLQALIVVGDIDVKQMEQTIKAKFADLKNPLKEKVRTKYTILLTGKNQFIAVTDKEMSATVAEVLIKHTAPKLRTENDYRQCIIHELFNQMLSQRYAELSQQATPPFVQGSGGIEPFLGGLDAFGVSVVAKPGELEKGFKAVWRETQRTKLFGFTQTELDRAKQAYLSQMETSFKEKDKTQSEAFVKQYLQYFLNAVAAPGISKEYQIAQQQMPGISLFEVNALTKTYIRETNRDILVLAPNKDKTALPNEATMNQWIKAVEQEKLEPYNDEVNKAGLLSAEPLPGKIVSEQKDAKLNITTLILSNGVKVFLKPTDFKNNEILFSAFEPGGTSVYIDADYQSAANAAGIVANFGAGNYDLNQLQKFLSGKQLQVQPLISDRIQGFKGGAVPKDLEIALQLLYAQFTSPRKDTAIFRGIIEQSKASLTNRGLDPVMVFQDSVSAILGNYNVRRTGPSIEKLDQISLDRAYAIYKERFADASGFTFTFVGSFDVNTIKPLLEKYLGALPATNSHEQAKDLGIHIPPGKIEKNIYKGSENKATVRLVFSGPFDYSLANTIQLDALKETLEFRLLERLREDEGGVYSPSAQASSVKYPHGRYSFVIAFGCAPKNVDKLIASTLNEIRKLKTEGPPQGNIDKYKAEERRQQETQLKTNAYWLHYLDTQLQNGDALDEQDQYASLLDKISPTSVKNAANQYLSWDNYIRLVLLPEKTQGQP
ncbi:M16 family metallopeptidase [Mucilaginibacter dorajii]|nr:insulinase family protein [Mucilaginibacter dorajii]MCS3732589.1 zinc protease [Mucilaginibacter dorajii]